ncbi:hypothetical protein I552_8722 [Mycobacterium xenopi 3993]|nr:hypothetical protein I552_8722 [Mycobacterium xenopi 3993]
MSTRLRGELFTDYGRPFPDDDEMAAFANIAAVTAIRE